MDWNLSPSTILPFDTVAPFVGVWIEISYNISGIDLFCQSLPSWECGLKSVSDGEVTTYNRSLPSWECGLKLILATTLTIFISRSLRGSVDWNIRSWMHVRFWKVAPFVGVWIEIRKYPLLLQDNTRRSLRGSVDWNALCCMADIAGIGSLPSWECGLKSTGPISKVTVPFVAPFVGVWIEI